MRIKSNDIGKITDEEKLLFNSIVKEFIYRFETSGIVKSYKMPILKAFYNKGNVKLEVNEQAFIEALRASITFDQRV